MTLAKFTVLRKYDMRILVSNDDGYFSPGIAALAQAMSTFGEVTVVAPEADRSGASNSRTLPARRTHATQPTRVHGRRQLRSD